MRDGETERQMVERHVREGEATLGRMRAVIQRLSHYRLSLVEAESLLGLLEHCQAMHAAHLARLQISS
jgi:hypothetical protein